MILSAIRLWETGVLYPRACRVSIDCGKLAGGTPRMAYLVPESTCCALDINAFRAVTTTPASMTNVLTGIMLQLRGGRIIVVDAASVQAIADACNSCCEDSATETIVPGVYNGTFPFVIDDCTPTLYEFGRSDYGSVAAYSKALMDYSSYAIPNTFQVVGSKDGVTYYGFMACTKPVFYQDDNIGPYYFESNAGEQTTIKQQLWFTLKINNVQVGPVIKVNTLDDLLPAIQADSTLNAQGTWSRDGSKIELETSNWRDHTLTIQLVGGNMYYTNAVNLQSSERATFTMTVAPSTDPLPNPPTGTLAEIVTAVTADPNYNQYGRYDNMGGNNQIELNAWFVGGYTLVLTKVSQMFQSNAAPSLSAGQMLQIDANIAGTALSPIYGQDIPGLLSSIQASTAWNSKGTWSQQASTYIRLTTTLIVPAAVLTISVATITYQSNDAPTVQPSQMIQINATVAGTALPALSAANVTALLAAIQANSTYTAKGTWAISGDRITLTTQLTFPNASLVLSLEQQNFDSNVPPTLEANEHYSLSGTVGGVTMALIDGGTTLDTILAAAQSDGSWGSQGTYSKTPPGNNALRLTTTIITPAASIIIGKMSGTFVSNQGPALETGEEIEIAGAAKGTGLPDLPPATDITNVLTVIQANATWNALGTWSMSGGNAVQVVTTFIDPAPSIYLSKAVISVESPDAPAIVTGELLQAALFILGAWVTPNVTGGTSMTDLLVKVDGTTAFKQYGTWGLDGNKLTLQTTRITPTPQVVVSKQESTFSSNALPTLSGGQTYTINATVAGNALAPISGAADANALLAAINANSSWTAVGTWTLNNNTIQLLTSLIVPAASIVVTAV